MMSMTAEQRRDLATDITRAMQQVHAVVTRVPNEHEVEASVEVGAAFADEVIAAMHQVPGLVIHRRVDAVPLSFVKLTVCNLAGWPAAPPAAPPTEKPG